MKTYSIVLRISVEFVPYRPVDNMPLYAPEVGKLRELRWIDASPHCGGDTVPISPC